MGGDHAPKAEVDGAVRAARILASRSSWWARRIWSGANCVSTRAHQDLPIDIRARQRAHHHGGQRRARRSAPNATVPCGWRRGWCATAPPRGSCRRATPAPSWPRPRWCRAWCRAWTGRRWRAFFPTVVKGSPVVVVDVGANVDCSPRMLAQFAVMGEIYSRVILGHPKPRVGILSIGEEDHKGNEVTRSAAPAAEEPGAELHRQRGRPGHLQRRSGRDRLRRLHRQRGAEGERGPGGHGAPPAARVARGDHHGQDRVRARQDGASWISRSVWITPSTAARRCWACGACASSATDARMPTPSRTRSAWPRSSPRGRSTSGSKTNCSGQRRGYSGGLGCTDALRLAPVHVRAACSRLGPAARHVAWNPALETASRLRPPAGSCVRATGRIDAGWHLYSGSTAAGIPTSFRAGPDTVVERVRLLQPKPVRAFDKNFGVDTETYEGEVVFLLELQLKKDAPAGPMRSLRFRPATRPATIPVRPRQVGGNSSTPDRSAATSAAPAIPAGLRRGEAAGGGIGQRSPRRGPGARRLPAGGFRIRPGVHFHAVRFPDDSRSRCRIF